MTDTTCPSCDAPAAAGARRCSRCGYRFVEDGGPGLRPRPSLTPVAFGGAALAVLAVAIILALRAGGTDEELARGSASPPHLDILSKHPVRTGAAERLLARRYFGARNDESAFVHCSGRVPKPAHSVRRCIVHYPGGGRRRVVLLTSANGAEVLSQP
jgi:ribosomal protein L40E